MTGNRSVLVLGSTGSIGTQALELIARHPERFTVAGLAAGGGDVALLAGRSARTACGAWRWPPRTRRAPLRELLPGVEVLAGPGRGHRAHRHHGRRHGAQRHHRLGRARAHPGRARRGATLALANKESLVAGGALVTAAAAPGQIVPVDSEHSALAQCLRGGRAEEVDRLVLTASGGPFRGRRAPSWPTSPSTQALAHPTWAMGPMVTINSATLINKGLELIEAHLLFGIPYDRIDVVVHPQSIVHSMVTFVDGVDARPGQPAGHAAASPRVGYDFAGIVEAVGPNVTRFKPGDEVFGGAGGALAEYVLAREDGDIVLKPAELTFEEAAAIPIAAITALQGLRDHGHIAAGQKVLINGASGGVGTYAVQIAKVARRRSHRRVQHAQRGARALARRGSRHRLHAGGFHRRQGALRPHPRQRRQSRLLRPRRRHEAGGHHRRRRRPRRTMRFSGRSSGVMPSSRSSQHFVDQQLSFFIARCEQGRPRVSRRRWCAKAR